MTPEEQQAIIDAYDGEIGMQLEDETPFLAEIRADDIGPGKFGGPQWHLAALPLHFQLRGKTGMFHEYYSLSNQARSKMGACLLGFSTNRILPKGVKVGRGQLIGTVCWFVRRDIKFGRDASGQQIMSEGVLIPVKAATSEEQALAGTVTPLAGVEPEAASGNNAAPTPANLDWNEDQISAVLAVIDGLAMTEIQQAIMSRNGAGYNLPRELKTATLSGAAVKYLQSINRITVQDGKVATIPF